MTLVIVKIRLISVINGRFSSKYAWPIFWHWILYGGYFYGFNINQFFCGIMLWIQNSVGFPGTNLDGTKTGVSQGFNILVNG